LPRPALRGAHQAQNAGLAIACLERLAGFDVSPDAIAAGLADAVWPARLQRLNCGPLVGALPDGWELWLDGGHNAAAGEALGAYARDHWSDKPLWLVCGILGNKQADRFLKPLAGPAKGMRAIAIPGEDSSFSADQVAKFAGAAGLAAEPAASAEAAIAGITGGKGAAGRILICGSLYLAGRILAENG
jgi:dihydrofolate synthase/folylpolyglutamate synthase